MQKIANKPGRIELSAVVRAGILAVALLLTAGIGAGWISGSAIHQIESTSRDFAMQASVRSAGDDQITLIDIDEASIRRVGSWPWSRAQIATLAERLKADLGAKVVVLDIVLPDPKDAAGDARLSRIAQDRELVLAQVFDFVDRDLPIISGQPGGALGVTGAGARTETGEKLGTETGSKTTGLDIRATGIVANHPGLQNSPCIGNIGFIPDEDGKLRSIIHRTSWFGASYPSLSLATVGCIQSSQAAELSAVPAVSLLRFDLAPDRWTVIPAADVLQADNGSTSTLKTLLKDRIVLIGSSALGLSDRVATPLSASISGMFVHAQAISELLSLREKRFFVQNDALYIALQSILVLGFGLVILQSKRLGWLSLAAGICALLWAGLLLNAVHNADPRPVSGVLIGLLALGLALIPYEWSQARARNRLTAKILARYVSKPVLKDLLAQKSFDPLKPRTAEITVLVADMVGYSEKVATQNLEKAAVITREFLDALTQPVWALRGTLDRYTGDGLVAFWGAPIPEKNHAALAVQAAIRMQKNLKLLNERLMAEGLPALSARIGIASGTAQVGDFGTQMRASYTAVGSCINMAARLEAAAKTLGVSVLIAEETANAASARGNAGDRDDFGGQNLSLLGNHEIRGIGEQNLYTLTDR